MQKRVNELHEPFYLSYDKKVQSRTLYEQVFSEDTEKFVDYYYSYKIKDNEILAFEENEQIISMLHLNPYNMIVNGYEVKSNYIVAVATHKDYRHKGYMRTLMEKALRDMAFYNMPFTFLMPVSESIYVPFDFAWMCPHTELPERIKQMGADEQNRYLAARYQMFCKRDIRYMENQEAERVAEEKEALPGKMPPYMVRITDVCQMLRIVGSRKKQKLYLHITDHVIEKNNGFFLWEISGEYTKAEKLYEQPLKLDMELTIGELTSIIFGGFRCCLSELV